jgi:hypothetical protein
MSSTTTSATSDSDESIEIEQAQTEKIVEKKTKKRKRDAESKKEPSEPSEKKQKGQDGEPVKKKKKVVEKEPCQCLNCKYKKPKRKGEQVKKRKRQVNLIEDGYVLHLTGIDQPLIDRVLQDFRDEDVKKLYPEGKAKLLDKSLIKMDLSKEQKAEIARNYRMNSLNRKKESGEVKELTDEELLKKIQQAEKRKQYNSNPKVKERKQKILNATREIQRELKLKNLDYVKQKLEEKLGPDKPQIRMRNYSSKDSK